MKNGRIVIDPEKPLPTELSKEYWETFAKLILEYFFPEKFYDLSVDDEKPDLRNVSANIGIEVTSVENEKSREIDSLYTRQYAYGNDIQKEKALKRMPLGWNGKNSSCHTISTDGITSMIAASVKCPLPVADRLP